MKKFILIFLSIGVCSLGILFFFFFYPETLGKIPSGEILATISKSPNYNKAKERFENRQADVIDQMFKKHDFLDSFIAYYSPTTIGWPKVKIKEQKDDLSRFNEESKAPIYSWLGHSSILLRLKNLNIFIDPVFSDFASPLSFIARRFQKPIYNLEEIPKVDIILISHDHYDHLDYETIQFYKNKNVKFIAPLGVDSHLIHWGVKKENISTFDWWDESEVLGIKFIATPAQHMSGREGFVGFKTLWNGWIIQTEKWNLFYSGDSGYDIHFKQIGEKYGPFDMVFLENGQYDLRWQAVHMMPYETAKAYTDLKAKRMFPVHWGMFNLSLHHWFAPPLDLAKNCEDCNIDFLPIGKIQSLKDVQTTPNEMFNFLEERKRILLKEN